MWGACLQGATWSVAGFFLIPFDSPILPSLYLVITAATTAGSLSLNSTYMPSLRGYMWAKLGGLTLCLLLEPQVWYWVLAASVAFYCLFLVRLGKRLHEILLSSYRLRFSREELVEKLSDAQLELRNRQEDLELRVKERTRSLENETSARIDMERRLHQAQRMETVGRLTGGIAHDFNNHLTVILNCLEHVEAELDRTLPSITTAKEAVSGGASLTKSLLVFSKQTNLTETVFDVRDVIHGISSGMLRRTLPANIEIVVDCPSERAIVKVDRAQLESSLLNLALNARDAMSQGGELRLHVSVLRNRVIIAVVDSGCGIPPDVLERVFEPFFSTKGDGGTGLGLSMVYGFIRQSGGDVSIDSGPKGTKVELQLPLASAGPTTATLSASEQLSYESFRGCGETVLLVEDNDSLRKTTRSILELLGYSVIQAGDVQSALEALRGDQEIHLVLSDVRMPGRLSGHELAQDVQNNWPHIRCILMTGYAPKTPESKRGELLHKPFAMLELAKRLRAELSQTGKSDCLEPRAQAGLTSESCDE